MSKFRNIVESIIYNSNILFESEQKINWILSQPKLVQQIENRIKSDSKVLDDITPEQLLKAFDGTSNVIGKFLPWVIKHYCNNEFEYNDLGLINNYLEDFTKSINKLNKKDINQYTSLDELINILNSVKDIKGTREKNRDAKSNAEKIYEDNKWLVLVPYTEEAAIQYGKGTRWCTAGINNNMFNYYNKKGPLYILINKQNSSEKYQFQFETNQFKNAEDKEINLKTFLKENPEIKKFFKSIRNFDKSDYENWIWFDAEELTRQDCLTVVKDKGGYVLQFVPEELRDYEMCLIAVNGYGSYLQFVPEELRDYNMCLAAVKNDGYALEFIPEELRDYNMCLAAVKNDKYALKYVPENLKDKIEYEIGI